MSIHFQRDFIQLKKDIYGMGVAAATALRRAVDALFDHDIEAGRAIIEADKEIDAKENGIDEDCMYLLALYQPVADDLRFILASVKANHDLERIGDHAKSLAKGLMRLNQDRPLNVPESMRDMARLVPQMVDDSVRSFQESDTELAQRVEDVDDQVDDAYSRVMSYYTDLMQKQPQEVENGVIMLALAKHLERAADLATNLCKEVVFLVEGKNIRHKGVQARRETV